MPKKHGKPPKYPEQAARTKTILSPLKGMQKSAIAQAAGLTRSQLSKLTGGEQRLTLELEKRLQAVVEQFTGQGFAESTAEYEAATVNPLRTVPEYRCTAAPDGEWRIAFSMPRRTRRLDCDLPSSAEIFAIKAPDNAAAPRYKKGDLIIFARDAAPGVGDDAFLCKRNSAEELAGFFGELLRSTETDFRLRQYCDPEKPVERKIEQWRVFVSMPIT